MEHGAVAGTMAQICIFVHVAGLEDGNTGGFVFVDWRFLRS